ncbi:hypothetical protein UB37_08715 [Photobacterium iliopiscarium]|uniref:Helicase ATP-binding domain-containing protein n=1 Tax=Photobacterium iliopiscarium TaxID=56192 RepID=A0ABX5GVL1_9GAMM|nr:hypothetical protein [Photobacterium iliopiscarium]KJG22497.1 hypothetical protein UB37_08715 [Photobacterium iliopiscarium]PSW98905.1 hypothetical protein C9J52_04310 [Photobacterium iliopiscarium]
MLTTEDKVKNKVMISLDKLSSERPEADKAAREIILLLEKNKFVCVTAETQMGKTTICRLIAKRNILALKKELIEKIKHKIIIYIENVSSNDLTSQAKDNFLQAGSYVEVVSITKAEQEIINSNIEDPITFMIDESHMGCDDLAKRLNTVFSLIEDRKNEKDKIILISATGFSSVYEAAKEKSIMGYSAAIYVVEPPKGYIGIGSFIKNNQVIDNSNEPCLVSAKITTPKVYENFINTIYNHTGGLYIIRATANETQTTKQLLLSLKDKDGHTLLSDENIKIVASSLKDVDKSELETWENVCNYYDDYKIRDKKLIVIVRGFLRVGIAMPTEMKEDLVATWDGTSSAVSSVVQALIGRACGYHNNYIAKHFANINMLNAHNELSEKLITFSKCSEIRLSDIYFAIQNITEKYNIPNWDAGLAGKDRKRIINRKVEIPYNTECWASYSFDPLTKLNPNIEDINELSLKLDLISDIEKEKLNDILKIIHRQYDPIKGEIPKKHGRKTSATGLLKETSKIISGQYVNKNTFISGKTPIKRKLEKAITRLLSGDKDVSFNSLLAQGAGRKKPEDLKYVAYVLSIYNTSKTKDPIEKEKSILSTQLLNVFLDTYNIKRNNTIIIFFKKGKVNEDKQLKLKLQKNKEKEKQKQDKNLDPHSLYNN